MNQAERLAEIEAVKLVKSHYFRFGDTKDLTSMRALFADDCVVDLRGSVTDPVTGEDAFPAVGEGTLNGVDAVMEAYLEGNEPSEETIKKCIRKAVLTGAFYPILCGSAFKNKGVQTLLDAVVDYLPSPLDIPPTPGIDFKTEEPVVRKASDDEPLSVLAFKIMDDPFVGSLTFCRLYSGKMETGMGLLNS